MDTVSIHVGRWAGEGYRVTLTDSAGLEVMTETMTVRLDVDEVVRTLLEARGPRPELREIGQELHKALLGGDVGREWRARTDGGARTLLHIDDPPLRRLPWELLADGDRVLATLPDQPIVRTAPTYHPQGPAPVTWPLQILVIVGIGEGGHGSVAGTAQELDRLQEALGNVIGLVDLEYLRQPSPSEITDACREIRPHVVHIIAHGDLDDMGSPCLVIEDARAGERWRWTAAAIAGDLPRPRPRLMVLNACRSAEVSAEERQEELRQGHRASWGVTDELLKEGVAGIVGMQGDIAGDAAAAFTAGFYAALASGDTVDVALTAARRRIWQSGIAESRADWALPTLVTRVHPDQILSRSPTLAPALRKLIEQQLYGFIDRSVLRQKICRRLRLSSDAGEAEADVITVDGPPGIGKTSLMRWCVHAAMLHGFNVAYVDLRGRGARSFMSVLGLIAHDLASNGPYGSGNQEAFDRWVSEVDELLGAAGRVPREDEEHRYHRRFPIDPPERAEEAIFRSFGRALQAAGADEGVILALDHAGEDFVERGSWNRMLVELLLKPVARHELPPVRVILAASPEYRGALATAVGAPESMLLAPFPSSRCRDFVRLYLLHRQIDTDVIDELVHTIVRLGKDTLVPKDLELLWGLATMGQAR